MGAVLSEEFPQRPEWQPFTQYFPVMRGDIGPQRRKRSEAGDGKWQMDGRA